MDLQDDLVSGRVTQVVAEHQEVGLLSNPDRGRPVLRHRLQGPARRRRRR